jgi:hypothetical protein
MLLKPSKSVSPSTAKATYNIYEQEIVFLYSFSQLRHTEFSNISLNIHKVDYFYRLIIQNTMQWNFADHMHGITRWGTWLHGAKRSPSWSRDSSLFMESEAMTFSQEPATGLYPKPVQSVYILKPYWKCMLILSSRLYLIHPVVSALRVLRPKFSAHCLSPSFVLHDLMAQVIFDEAQIMEKVGENRTMSRRFITCNLCQI